MHKRQVDKHAHLLHNPKAGDRGHLKADLIKIVTSCGYTCEYTSTKEKEWGRLKNKTMLVVIAGGDGTVRQVMKKLLVRKVLDKRLTVALIPAGTANNFAKTLGASASPSDLGRAITDWNLKHVDIGAIGNLRGAKFFLEGMGCGLLPKLIKEMKEADLPTVQTAEQELDIALEKLVEITKHYEPKWAEITIDGSCYEDNYLLVEVLNIKSVGPNLELAPKADPTDGKFQVALLKEADREAFISYLQHCKNSRGSNKRPKVPWQLIEANQSITIRCDNRLVHVDDELIAVKKRQPIKVEIRPGIIDMIV